MRLIKISFLLVMTMVLMASCLSSDSSETTLHNDAVITGFTLGTMNIYLDGSKGTYSGSSCFFNIDQADNVAHTFKDTTIIGRCVYNNDSLPLGTDLKHVVSTITTKNNGAAIIERLDEPDVFDYYSLLDSIDYTKPRRVIVFSSDGSAFNQYFISVDAHQEDGNDFVWKLMEDGWQPPLDAKQLPDGIKQVLGSSTTEQYALSTDNKLMVSHDNGATWDEEPIWADADKLPTQDLSLISYPMLNADSVDYVLLVGNREVNEQNNEAVAMVWRKEIDYSQRAPNASWTYMERNAVVGDSLALPRMKNLTIMKYDDGILAIGGEGIGGWAGEPPYTAIYQSRDNGITWKLNPLYYLPEDFDRMLTTKVHATVDDENFIWLYCEGSGQVWRGRLNRLGWERK